MSLSAVNYSAAAVNPPEETTADILRFPAKHYRKDGQEKTIVCNKKTGVKSEVYAFSMEDMRRLNDYFAEHEMWLHLLAFRLSCNMARRIGDILSLKWENIYESNGHFRNELKAISEEKTGKLSNPHINQAVRNAIVCYCEKTGCNPASDYSAPVFLQLSGNYRGRVLSYSAYLKSLKRAAGDLGIQDNIGTHSARKTFGKYSKQLHSGDPNAMEVLQGIYNHSSASTTRAYIGLTREARNEYYDTFGEFFEGCLNGDETTLHADTPVIHIGTDDMRELLKLAYSMGAQNAGNPDPQVHIDAYAELVGLAEEMKK